LPPGTYQIQVQLHSFEGPLPVNGTDRLILTEVTLPPVSPVTVDHPLSLTVEGHPVVSGFSLWQAGDYYKLNLPEYQPRMAIPFIWQGQPSENEQVKWLLVDPQGQTYPAHSASPHFEYFKVQPDWPPGLYRLWVEVWRDGAVIASQETGPLLTVFNKQPRTLTAPPITHPLDVNFANRLKLLGYDLPQRNLLPGQNLPVTLYWQALRPVSQDYTFFTKLLDDQSQAWGSVERYARDGYKTTHWLENEVVVDQFELLIDLKTPPGIYRLNTGLYFGLNQTVIPLPVAVNKQMAGETSLTFGSVKVGGPPAGIVVGEASPQYPLEKDLGNIIRLHGYDLALANNQLRVKLYWQSLNPTEIDYTVFLHLQNQKGEIVAQTDRLPANGAYPTSLWSPGEIIPDELQVTLPDNLPSIPQSYAIVGGMYNLRTGERLPVAGSSEDSITLTTLPQ
jgi:hypothetical protein